MTTKAQRKAIVDEKVNHEKARILEIMRKSDLYTITLDPLIESYLDIFKFTNTSTCCGKKKVFQKHKKQQIKLVLQTTVSIAGTTSRSLGR